MDRGGTGVLRGAGAGNGEERGEDERTTGKGHVREYVAELSIWRRPVRLEGEPTTRMTSCHESSPSFTSLWTGSCRRPPAPTRIPAAASAMAGGPTATTTL